MYPVSTHHYRCHSVNLLVTDAPNKDCNRRDMLFGSCKFEPRFDQVVTEKLDIAELSKAPIPSWDMIRMIEAAKVKIYSGEICIRCGLWVEKPFREKT